MICCSSLFRTSDSEVTSAPEAVAVVRRLLGVNRMALVHGVNVHIVQRILARHNLLCGGVLTVAEGKTQNKIQNNTAKRA